MHLSWTSFSKNVAAFGLSAALALGGMTAVSCNTFADVAFADDVAVTTAADVDVATTFTFSDSGIVADGTAAGYKIEGTALTINAAGTYRVTGSCAKGSIAVKKGVAGVTLVIEDLTLANDGDKAIKFKQGSSGTIVLSGTNTLSTDNDKGIIKANAVADDNDDIVYASDGTTTGGDLVITGDGTLNLSSSYTDVVDGETVDCDAINCEGDLTVLSGTFNINVTDDAMHADNTLTIGAEGTDGPTINVESATEGLEGATVNLLSGTGDIATTDDGVNAANKDLTSYGWQYGITVAGGTWKVVAGGDGIDSNGNLTVSGGTTEVYCTGNGNGALDIGEGAEGEIRGAFKVTGGTLFAVGSDMAITPTTGNYVMFGGGAMGAMGGGQPGQMSMPGQMGQAGQAGQMGQVGQASQTVGNVQQAQVSAQPESSSQQDRGPQASESATVVQKGESTSVSVSGETLFQTTASSSGSYALFASDSLASNSEVTLISGTTTTKATVGATSSSTSSQPGQQPDQQPNQTEQSTDGKSGNDQQASQNGQQPPALPDGSTPDGQQPPALPDGSTPDGQQPDQNAQPGGELPDSAQQNEQGQPSAADATANTGEGPAKVDEANTTENSNATAGAARSDESDKASGETAEKSEGSNSKAENTMTVSRKVKSVKASVLSKRAKTVKAITVKNAKGKVTYTKVSGSKYLEVNKTTGEITVKKGAPKGIYSAKVRVKAAGDSNYDSTTKTVTVKVRVK